MKDKKKRKRKKDLMNKINIPYQTMRKIKKGHVMNYRGITLLSRADHELAELERYLMRLVIDSLIKEKGFVDLVKDIIENIAKTLRVSSWAVLDVSSFDEPAKVIYKMGMNDEEFVEFAEKLKGEIRVEKNMVGIPVSIDEDTILIVVLGWDREETVGDPRIFSLLQEKLEGILKNSVRLRSVFEERYKDHLTGVLNRKALERDLKSLGDFSVLFIDVDDFKNINDEFGHTVGDEILKDLSSILKKSLRSADRVYRYGGDEFVVVLPKTDLGTAQRIAERLEESVSKLSLNGIPLSVSIGVASSSEGSKILSRADERMYGKKRRKKRKNAS